MYDTIKIDISSLEHMSEAEFFRFCQDNRHLRIERNKNKEIIIMSPTGSYTGKINTIIIGQLYNWNLQQKKGILFDSSTGFTLPDTSVLSPDASFISHERWDALSPEQQEVFAPLCPEFVVELKSKNDRIEFLKEKMGNWIQNGVQLAFLIDPEASKVYVYRANGTIDLIEDFSGTVSGENVLPGFELQLKELK